MGRRYSIKVDGQTFDPAEFNAVRAYNPRGLKKGAVQVAQFIADTFDVDVEVVKHLATGSRIDAIVLPR